MRNRLAELRQERGQSQEDLAAVLGVSRQTIIAIERGKFNPSLPLAFKIAATFRTPIEHIFFPDEDPPSP